MGKERITAERSATVGPSRQGRGVSRGRSRAGAGGIRSSASTSSSGGHALQLAGGCANTPRRTPGQGDATGDRNQRATDRSAHCVRTFLRAARARLSRVVRETRSFASAAIAPNEGRRTGANSSFQARRRDRSLTGAVRTALGRRCRRAGHVAFASIRQLEGIASSRTVRVHVVPQTGGARTRTSAHSARSVARRGGIVAPLGGTATSRTSCSRVSGARASSRTTSCTWDRCVPFGPQSLAIPARLRHG